MACGKSSKMAERFERKANVLVLGAAGVGKSTWLNDYFGASFRTGRQPYSVTQTCDFFECTFDGTRVRVWDCPGIFDGERTIEDWSTDLERSTEGCGFAQIFMVVNATTRPGTLDGLVTIGLRCLLEQFRIEKGVTVVFTHLDAASDYYDPSCRAQWVQALNKKCKFQEKGLEGIDPNSTIGFVETKVLTSNPTHMVVAAEKMNVKAEKDSVLQAVSRAGAIVVKRGIKSGLVAKPVRVAGKAAKEVLKHAVEAMGNEAVAEYVETCYDADTTFVLKWNSVSATFDRRLAVDVEPGDKIMNASLMPDEVLIKNVQFPKIGIMNEVTMSAPDGSFYFFTLSPGHYVHVFIQGKQISIPSRDLKVGQTVRVRDASNTFAFAEVTNIEVKTVAKTVSLRTRSLTLLVNSVVGSSRAEGDAGLLGHGLALVSHAMITNGAQKLQNLAFVVRSQLRSPRQFLKLLARVFVRSC